MLSIIPTPCVVLDLETTGLDSRSDEIIEIGFCKILGNEPKMTAESFVVRPSRAIPDEIAELTGITNELVAEAPEINDVLPDFIKSINGLTVVSYNSSFDTSFLAAAAAKMNIYFTPDQFCLLRMARKNWPMSPGHSLTEICEFLKIDVELSAHRALGDVVRSIRLIQAAQSRHERNIKIEIKIKKSRATNEQGIKLPTAKNFKLSNPELFDFWPDHLYGKLWTSPDREDINLYAPGFMGGAGLVGHFPKTDNQELGQMIQDGTSIKVKKHGTVDQGITLILTT